MAGGVLTTLSWRWTFAANVPLIALSALGVWRWAERDPRIAGAGRPRVPVVAAALGTGAAAGLALGLTDASQHGWGSPRTIVMLALALALAIGFVRHEFGARPLIDRVLRPVASLWWGAGAAALYMASVGSVYYLLTLLLQESWGYSALRAGFGFLPMALLVAVGSAGAPVLWRSVGLVTTLFLGFAASAVGLGWLAMKNDSFWFPSLVGGLIVAGLGNGITFATMFSLGTRDIAEIGKATAGGVIATSQYASSTLTLALLTLILGTHPEGTDFRAALNVLAALALAGAAMAVLAGRSPGLSRLREPGRSDANESTERQVVR